MRTVRRRVQRSYFAESLEPRTLLAAVPHAQEFRAHAATTGPQSAPAVAMDADGDHVIAWQSDDGSGLGVFAQRFDDFPGTIGNSFRANAISAGNQHSPAVAVDADGDIIVAWVSDNQDGSGQGVYARRYSVFNAAIGEEFRVNTSTAGDQSSPSVAADADGNFVIAWQSAGQDGSGGGVYAQRYDAAGAAAGDEFRVNTVTAPDQRAPAVAMAARGNFVVAWESEGQDGSQSGVYARRYSAAGAPAGGEFLVNVHTASAQQDPAVAMDADGDFVVVWESYDGRDGAGPDVYARRYTATGAAAGGEFRVNSGSGGNPSVAMAAGGNYVVAWDSDGADGSSTGVYARQYTPGGAGGGAGGAELRANTTTAGPQGLPALAGDADGNFVVTWAGSGPGDPDGVYGQHFVEPGHPAGPFVTDAAAWHFSPTRDAYATRLTAGQVLGDPVTYLHVTFSRDVADRADRTHWRLTRNGADVSGQIAFGDYRWIERKYVATVDFVAPLADGEYVLTLRDTLRDQWGNPLDGDRDGVPGGSYSLPFTVATPNAIGPELRVNELSSSQAFTPQPVAMSDDGSFVVVWLGGGLGDAPGDGVYARRYGADGRPLGPDFRVNTSTQGIQGYERAVAMDAAGNFVVVWEGIGPSPQRVPGIYGQRYNSAGEPVGGEFTIDAMVTPGPTVLVYGCAVAMDATGNFVVTWARGSGVATDVFARRYDAAGQPLGSALPVNSFTAGIQRQAAIAMDRDGDFVVAWASDGQDGSEYGVYAQRYSAAGERRGGEFPVNVTAEGDQQTPSVAMDHAGNFVVAWHGVGTRGGTMFRRYDAAGAPRGGEERAAFKGRPAVAADADGDFVIAYADGDGSGTGVRARRFNAAGVPQGGAFRVNTYSGANQNLPAVATSPAGDFVIAWSADAVFGVTAGVYAQRYTAAPTAPSVTAAAFRHESAPHHVTFAFDKNVSASLDVGDLRVVTVPGGAPVAVQSVSFDARTLAATFTLAAALPNGNYSATLLAPGVTDLAGRQLAAGRVTDFYVLTGDINRDRSVNATDFAILAGNFGKNAMTYAQGDLNGDGSVGGSDFALLAGNFGKAVPPPPAAAAVAPSPAPATAGPAPSVPPAKTLRRRAALARRARPAAPAGPVAGRRTAP